MTHPEHKIDAVALGIRSWVQRDLKARAELLGLEWLPLNRAWTTCRSIIRDKFLSDDSKAGRMVDHFIESGWNPPQRDEAGNLLFEYQAVVRFGGQGERPVGVTATPDRDTAESDAQAWRDEGCEARVVLRPAGAWRDRA